jgi:hypothetical protein
MTASIFRGYQSTSSLIWEPPPEYAAARRAPTPKLTWSASTDVALLAILESPLRNDETAAIGFARKEAELRDVIAKLTVPEARVLQSRLSNPQASDQVATAFQRMTGERRARVINFLADARRREALKGGSNVASR